MVKEIDSQPQDEFFIYSKSSNIMRNSQTELPVNCMYAKTVLLQVLSVVFKVREQFKKENSDTTNSNSFA